MDELDRKFRAVGGEVGVRRIVDRFYDLMDELPEARVLRALHPSSLEASRDKLTWFMTGWLGGPPRYVERFGHPRLRARHLRVSIGVAERDAWMVCMRRALEELVEDEMLRETLCGSLSQLADHLRNREG
jgi:hemoglobin